VHGITIVNPPGLPLHNMEQAGLVVFILVALPKCYPDDDEYNDGPQATAAQFHGTITRYKASEKIIHNLVFWN
jgi:hypothetical protein